MRHNIILFSLHIQLLSYIRDILFELVSCLTYEIQEYVKPLFASPGRSQRKAEYQGTDVTLGRYVTHGLY